MRYMSMAVWLCLVLGLWLPASQAADRVGIYHSSHLYVTRTGWEPDKGASAWLILRFIDPRAKFRQVAEGKPLGQGAPFDVPESEFRRTHRYSAFENLLRAHRLEGERLRRMALIIHDLEINTWGPPLASESPKVKAVIASVRSRLGPDEISIECGIAVFDGVYEALETGDWRGIAIRLNTMCKREPSGERRVGKEGKGQ